uniref:Uncharacterized protein n=1 Tax=Opuntia streptacantha TaxID=393608 RepID=A0A7C9E5R5_OPUST
MMVVVDEALKSAPGRRWLTGHWCPAAAELAGCRGQQGRETNRAGGVLEDALVADDATGGWRRVDTVGGSVGRRRRPRRCGGNGRRMERVQGETGGRERV